MKEEITNFILFHLILVFIYINLVLSIETTEDLCYSTTDQLIEYYGYQAEVHHVTTEDGYILTMFRCNSNTTSPDKKKPLIALHGIFGSSDDFCMNPPNQSLAYFFADAGYDVWIPNCRGNFYSRKHLSKDPDTPSSGYWNFTWYEIGVYDQPAIIDYILQETSSPKLFYIGDSQGSTSIMALLSEKIDYNQKVYAASFIAPVGYVKHIFLLYQVLAYIIPVPGDTIGFELLPRTGLLKNLQNLFCQIFPQICEAGFNLLFGSSDQRNPTILRAQICHFPAGASIKQFFHYAQQIKFKYFGKYKTGSKIPEDFLLSQITIPISLHYSTSDYIADATDVELLIPKLGNVSYVQRIDDDFDHLDFVYGMDAANLVYSKILDIFQEKYE